MLVSFTGDAGSIDLTLPGPFLQAFRQFSISKPPQQLLLHARQTSFFWMLPESSKTSQPQTRRIVPVFLGMSQIELLLSNSFCTSLLSFPQTAADGRKTAGILYLFHLLADPCAIELIGPSPPFTKENFVRIHTKRILRFDDWKGGPIFNVRTCVNCH